MFAHIIPQNQMQMGTREQLWLKSNLLEYQLFSICRRTDVHDNTVLL